jgi:serine O-acetyltransferase
MSDLQAQAHERRSAVVLELLTVKGLAGFLYRLAHAAGKKQAMLGLLIKQLNHVLTGADIAWQATIGPGLLLYHPTGVVIGPHVRAGARLEVQQGVTLGGEGGRAAGLGSSPVLGDDVTIGAGAKVLGSISIGDGAVIGANSVVLRSVPAGRTAVGVPARVLPETHNEHQIGAPDKGA